MKKPFTSLLLLSLMFSVLVFSHRVQAQQTPQEQDDVVRITSNLVQIDAVITDKDGNQVTDLTSDDFEIYQDGKTQKITDFSYINTETGTKSVSAATAKGDKKKSLTLPVRIRPNNAGRILTFIVDDGNCDASQIGIVAAKEALDKFVKEQMQPNDLIAVYQTRNGSSLLQQYTSDKTRLQQVIRKIRWYPPLGVCDIGSGGFFEPARSSSALIRDDKYTFESAETRKQRERNEEFISSNQVIGATGVMRYVIGGLERMPGRKTVFFMSDGITIQDRDGGTNRAYDVMREVVDSANRASVTFHTIDVRGLLDPSAILAEDEVLPDSPTDEIQQTRSQRQSDFIKSQNGLVYLSYGTGGRFYQNMNFLDVAVRRALNLEKGFYVLAYEPDDETFKGKEFHNILVKVKRSGLSVRSRRGFYGITDEEKTRSVKRRTGDSELYDAIIAPLPNAGLNLRTTAFFGNTAAEGDFVRSLTHIDGKDITFVNDPSGMKRAVFDVVAVTLNEKNEVVDEFNRTHTIKLEERGVPIVKQSGYVYTADVPIKKSGGYTFRIAIRDASGKMLGSASQFIEAPDLKKGKFYLSGLTVSGVDANGKFVSPSGVKIENAFAPVISTAVPAVRRFSRNSVLAYSYTIYNAQTDKATNQPKLTVKYNLYRDGQMFVEGKPQPAQLEQQTDLTRINDYGYLRLNQNLQPGDYAVQIIVTDTLKNQTTSQWIDFEVVN